MEISPVKIGKVTYYFPYVDGIYQLTSPQSKARLDPVSKQTIRPHNGQDSIGFIHIVSTCFGVVKQIKYDSQRGNYVDIICDNGFIHRYQHFKNNSICVNAGQIVTPSTVIGEMGSTGNSTGNHLHYEVMDNKGNYLEVSNIIGVPNKKGKYTQNREIKMDTDKKIRVYERYPFLSTGEIEDVLKYRKDILSGAVILTKVDNVYSLYSSIIARDDADANIENVLLDKQINDCFIVVN